MIQTTLIGVALLHAVLGFLVFRARRDNVVNRAFAAQSLIFAGWIFSIAGLRSNGHLDLRFGFVFAFASLIPIAFLSFSYCYPATVSRSTPLYAKLALVVGLVFAALSLTTSLIVNGTAVTSAGLSRKTGPLYPAFALYFIATWCVGLSIFVKKWRSARGLVRAQFHYLGAGVIGGFVGGISMNLIFPIVTGQTTYSWIGPYFSLAYVGFVAHAIIRHRLMDLRLFIHRGLTIALAITLSAIPAALLIAVFWPRLLEHLDATELAMLVVATGIVTIATPITRDTASRVLDRYVYRTHANYQRTVREASQMLTRVLNLDTLLAFISSTVVRSTAVEGVALYLLREGAFHRAITLAPPGTQHFVAPLEAPAEIVIAVDAAQAPILTDEVARERDPSTSALPRLLSNLYWSLVLPVQAEDTLIAIIAVGPKLSGDAFYRQDLDLLMTLANQAGVAIKNAQLYAAVALANDFFFNDAATTE